jgi:hypothetical protein
MIPTSGLPSFLVDFCPLTLMLLYWFEVFQSAAVRN